MNIILMGDSLFGGLNKTDIEKLKLKIPNSTIINGATCGINSDDLVAQVPLFATVQDVVYVISIGMNDIAPWKSVPFDRFAQNIRTIIETLQPMRAYFFLPPAVDEEKQPGTDKRSNVELCRYSDEIKRICSELKAEYIDASDEYTKAKNSSDYHDADGVHMNEVGDEIMFTKIASCLLNSSW